jgi:hypothetical protein
MNLRCSISHSPENSNTGALLRSNPSLHQALSPNSADHGAGGSVSSGDPLIDVAIAKWFELLAGDASFENLDFLENEGEIPYDVNGPESPTEQRIGKISSVRRAYQNAQDREREEFWTRRTRQPESSAQEHHPWQSVETLALLGHESYVFENFVKRVSTWV